MELGKSPEALSTGALQSMSLKDLEAKIHESAVANISRSEIFDVLMTWFNEQIKQDIITQSNYLLDRFVMLLHMRNYADIEPFNLTQVDEMFNGWLEKDIIQNPAYRRKYLIIQQDVHRLFADERRDSQNSGASSLFDCEHELREMHSPSLSCEQEDNSMRAEENTSLQQDTGHSTHISAAQQFIYLARAKTVGIDQSDRSHVVKHMGVILPQQSSDTHSQDVDADDVIIARETIDIGFTVAQRTSTLTMINRQLVIINVIFVAEKPNLGNLKHQQEALCPTTWTVRFYRYVLGTDIDLAARNNALGTIIDLAVQNATVPAEVELTSIVLDIAAKVTGICHGLGMN
ncbi:hypothetical protein E0Z10_g4592 [Xylaria hypoxylon]|uniref:Uncharacterized protein n=1 Tax=Xylaria hypoxylon TaxID=37992 RepID=A0A4Z0Z3J9_9PEZI|nr:hypothetical protein E0Z10_g4592 [Xylaria hypoxylon]